MVYFIQIDNHLEKIKDKIHNGLIKIGYASETFNRLANFQDAFPFHVRLLLELEGNTSVENYYHTMFKEYRAYKREWFYPGPELLKFIRKNRSRKQRYNYLRCNLCDHFFRKPKGINKCNYHKNTISYNQRVCDNFSYPLAHLKSDIVRSNCIIAEYNLFNQRPDNYASNDNYCEVIEQSGLNVDSYYKPSEVIKYLDISMPKLRYLIFHKMIPYYKIGQKTVRIKGIDIAKLMISKNTVDLHRTEKVAT